MVFINVRQRKMKLKSHNVQITQIKYILFVQIYKIKFFSKKNRNLVTFRKNFSLIYNKEVIILDAEEIKQLPETETDSKTATKTISEINLEANSIYNLPYVIEDWA